MSDEHTRGDAGASDTYPIQCSALRKNGHVMIKGHPCKIVDMSTSKTGKHGHAKVHLVALDIFDGKKYEDICPSTHNMNVPNVKRTEYICSEATDEDFLFLMNEAGEVREDIKAEGSILQEVRNFLDKEEECVVSVVKACGIEKPMSVKKSTGK